MLKHLTDLIINMSIIPFVDERVLYEDKFQEVIKKKDQSLYKSYKDLQEGCFKQLPKQEIQSLDLVYMLFEKYFPISKFQQATDSNTLYYEYIRDLAKCFICHRDGIIALKYWGNSTYDRLFEGFEGLNKIELWNTFSRKFCLDLLVMMYLVENEMWDPRHLNGYYWLINVGDKQLDQILEKGVAETHIHINAGIYFSTIWESILQINEGTLDKHPVLKELGKEKYHDLINKMAIARMVMCHYLLIRSRRKIRGLKEYLYEGYDPAYSENQSIQFQQKIIKIFEHLALGKSLDLDYRDIYNQLTSSDDTIKSMFLSDGVDTTEENIFLFESLKYLKQHNDSLYGEIFWRYITLKNIIYQAVTQNNALIGLDFFQYYFAKATYKMQDKSDYLEAAIKNQIYNNHLEKLEIRVGPPTVDGVSKIKTELIDDIRRILIVHKKLLKHELLKEDLPQMGIVMHLIKEKDKLFFEKCWCKEDIYKANQFYGKIQKRYMETIEAITYLRHTIPGLSRYLVGIDTASLENNTEPWVFAPVYQHARESHHPRYLIQQGNMEPIQSLGFTYHVGEDFRHLLTGLRHIDEVVEHFGYHAGDRIGHGIALGIDVTTWCQENPIAIMPRIEYMENLLWLWGLEYRGMIDRQLVDIAHIEREIMKQAHVIYHNLQGIDIYQLWLTYQKRFEIFSPNPCYLQEICITQDKEAREKLTEQANEILGNKYGKFCNQADSAYGMIWNAEKLLHTYHCKCYLERMYEVIQIKVQPQEAEVLKNLQRVLCQNISLKGIVVETNPTSNLAISGIERLFRHHALELTDKGLIVTVNSDDPVVFNTNISNELAYVFYTLQEKGYTRDITLEWINKIRQWGLDTSFIRGKSISPEEREKEIDSILDALR